MQAERKNMERMEEAVKDGDEQRLQHMLTNSAWLLFRTPCKTVG
jgi:hypothetical protein